jgi:ABC-type Mn2+/Zn2+ transport system permease subunit
MNDFLAVLEFTWVPLVGAAAFSLTVAPLGALLSLRDEILLGLALPPVGTAAIVIGVFLGIPVESTFILYLIAVTAIMVVSTGLSGRSNGLTGSPRWRAGLLAAVFCAAEAVTILLSAVSANVEAHVQHLLRGEMLAIGTSGLIGFLVLTIVIASFLVRYRGLVFAMAIDEEGLLVKVGATARRALLLFRLLSSLLIAAGVIWVGPLLTLALMAIPTIILERRPAGIATHFLRVTAVAIVAVTVGFAVSIIADVPPVPIVVMGLFVVGGCVFLLGRRS